MKKNVIFLTCAIVGFLISSCRRDALNVDPNSLDNFTKRCWTVTVEQKKSDNKAKETWHEWCDERTLVISLQKGWGGTDYKVSYQADNRYINASSCLESDNK